jgi:hypothetical protein
MALVTVAQPRIQAKFCTVYDEPATIAKWGQALYVIYPDGRIEDFAIEMAPFVTVLGDCQTADVQAMWDRIAGGPAAVACGRQMEVR